MYKSKKINSQKKIVKIHQKNIMVICDKTSVYVDDPIGFELDMFSPSNKDKKHKHPNWG